MNCRRRTWIHGFATALLTMMAANVSARAEEWKPHEVRQLGEPAGGDRLPAKLQIVTEKWNRVVAVPYIVYMPERDRLLMLVSCDYPHRPMVLTSDDRGATWSQPHPVLPDEPAHARHLLGVSLTYLGDGQVLCGVEGRLRCRSIDYGQTWSSEPIPPNSHGGGWNQWDPYLVDRDATTGKVTQLAETGYRGSTGGGQEAFLRSSRDLGKTWNDATRVPQWAKVSEVALARAANGDIVAACRTDIPPSKQGETLDHFEGLGVSISADDGRTWSEVRKLFDWGRHHPSLVVMPTGDIVMTYVVRKGYIDTEEGYPQFGIEAIVSRDHGKSWDLDHRYLLHTWVGNRKGSNQSAPGPQAWWASSQATSTVLLPDGNLLTAFGTGYRSQPNAQGMSSPRDAGLMQWSLSKRPSGKSSRIRDAAPDSDLRNWLDPRTGSILAEESAGVLSSRWVTSLPSVAIASEHNVIEPVAVRTRSGSLLVAAEHVAKNESAIVLSRSADQGQTWNRETGHLVQAKAGYRVSAGAAGMLPSGRLVLACHEWQEKRGKVEHVREEPVGVHHYRWSGYHRASVLKAFLSDDDGKSWTAAIANVAGGPVATAAMGTVFAADRTVWLPVYGPADDKQTDAALSGVGLMRSDDNGQSWKFSHWIAKADEAHNIGYGPGDVTVLPDGRWLGLLQGNYRGLGDYTRPRVCRTISPDAGRTWSVPEQKFLNHGTSTVTLDGRDGEEIMVGGWKDRGVHFTVGTNAGEDWLYQDQVWWCIWYGAGNRGGIRLLKLDEGVLAVYHWMDDKDLSRTQVRSQMIRRATGPTPDTKRPTVEKRNPQAKWRMAEAYQLPHIADAPAGIRIKTLLKLRSGDWICVGYVGSKKADTAYGFAPTGVCALRAAKITGPWKKIADIPMPPEVGGLFDTGTGAGTPGAMMQHSCGRLFLPLSTSNRKDIILTCSDTEGKTWRTIGSMSQITGLPAIHEADKIVERKDGSLVFPMQRPFHGESKQHPLFYVRSSDRGETWTAPAFWATHPGTRYEGLPHGSFADLRETSLAVLNDNDWLGIFRESRGTQSPENAERGPLSMPFLCLARSTDDGRTWKSSFGFLGVEPDIEALPGGAVMATFRDDNLASVWISFDKGVSWQIQHDPAELPWRTGAAEQSTQWPPGGEPIIRVIDDKTVAVICDSGMIPSGKLLPPDYKLSKEFQGRVQVRFFRRELAERQPNALHENAQEKDGAP